MKSLFQGCRRSNITVSPKNWNTRKASTSKPWVISYRFYDPAFKGTDKWGYLVQFRGMNEFKGLPERQNSTRVAIEQELEDLDENGYNPITGTRTLDTMVRTETSLEVDENTPYLSVLRFALGKIQVEPDTLRDITGVLKYYELSAMGMNLHEVALKNIKRKDIEDILDNCKSLTITKRVKGKVVTAKKIWNDNQFNHYRKYLQVLYALLEKREIIEYNPVDKIDKRDTVVDETESRLILTKGECARIIDHLKVKSPTFCRFINIFYHSGARPVELLRIRAKHVDLEGQRFKVLVKKGRGKKKLKTKTIMDVALPYWKDLLQGCGPEDFIFSIGLKPGAKQIRRDQLSRRWQTHVKDALGIEADLYSLKHLHTTEVIDILEKQDIPIDEATRQLADHNTEGEKMIAKVYDINRNKREHNKVKGIRNPFGG